MKKKAIPIWSYPVLAAILILLDQWSKYLVVLHLKGQKDISLISGVLELTYLENRGAAFGLLQDQRILFLISGLLLIVAVFWFFRKASGSPRFLPLKICLTILLAGALGNMIDRVRLGYVVDFIYVKLIDFPVFNVADIYVTVTAFLLVFFVLCYYKEEDFEEIFGRGKRKTD